MSDAMFTIVPVFIGLIFVLVIGSILFSIVRGVGEWTHNNAQPVLDVAAKVIAKRSTTNGHMRGGINHHSHGRIHTDHFVTFEMNTGERKEFIMKGSNFGVLLEGDQGILSYQGTRFKKFSVQN